MPKPFSSSASLRRSSGLTINYQQGIFTNGSKISPVATSSRLAGKGTNTHTPEGAYLEQVVEVGVGVGGTHSYFVDIGGPILSYINH